MDNEAECFAAKTLDQINRNKEDAKQRERIVNQLPKEEYVETY